MLKCDLYLPTKESLIGKDDVYVNNVISNLYKQIENVKEDIKHDINFNIPIKLRDKGWSCRRVEREYFSLSKTFESGHVEIIDIWFCDSSKYECKINIGSYSSRGNFSISDFKDEEDERIYEYYYAHGVILTDNDFKEWMTTYFEEVVSRYNILYENYYSIKSVIDERSQNQAFYIMKTWFEKVWYMYVAKADKNDYVRVDKSIINYPFNLTWRGKQVCPYDGYWGSFTMKMFAAWLAKRGENPDFEDFPIRIVYSEDAKNEYLENHMGENNGKDDDSFVKISTLKLNNEWIKH